MTTMARGTRALVLAAAATLLAGCGGGHASAVRPHHWELDTGDTRVLDLRPSHDTPPSQLIDVPAGSRTWVVHMFCSRASGAVTVAIDRSTKAFTGASTPCTRSGNEGLVILGAGPSGILPRRSEISVTAPGGAHLSVAVDASPRRD